MKVLVNGTLDYETQKSYQLVVRAYDGQGRFGDLTLNIALLDVNDIVPQFEEPSYSTAVNETAALGKYHTLSSPSPRGTQYQIPQTGYKQHNQTEDKINHSSVLINLKSCDKV